MNLNTHKLVDFAEAVAAQLNQQAKLGQAAIKARTNIDAALLAQMQQTISKAHGYISAAETGLGFAPELEIPF
jgi:hypothetical protein